MPRPKREAKPKRCCLQSRNRQPRPRPVKTITAINAEMRFLNAKNKAGGDPFTEFVFEEGYVNAATGGTVPGGTISVYVEADIPRGYEVDYWLINHVPYHITARSRVFALLI